MHASSSTFWDQIASRYSKQAIADTDTYNRKLKATQDLMTPDMHVLELGCGTGSTAIEHAPHVEQIVATDLSGKMIDIGRDKALKAGIQNVEFKQAGVEDFEDQIGRYDMVLALNLIHLLPDRSSTLAKIHQLLKPKGLFISSTACLADKMWYLRSVIPVMRLMGKAPDHVQFLRDSELLKEFESYGFSHREHWTHGRSNSLFLITEKI